MRKPIIAGNWKMYKSFDEAVEFVEAVREAIPSADKVDAVICAPAIYLPTLVDIADGNRFSNRCTKYAL